MSEKRTENRFLVKPNCPIDKKVIFVRNSPHRYTRVFKIRWQL